MTKNFFFEFSFVASSRDAILFDFISFLSCLFVGQSTSYCFSKKLPFPVNCGMNVDVKSDVVVFYEEQLFYPFDLSSLSGNQLKLIKAKASLPSLTYPQVLLENKLHKK